MKKALIYALTFIFYSVSLLWTNNTRYDSQLRQVTYRKISITWFIYQWCTYIDLNNYKFVQNLSKLLYHVDLFLISSVIIFFISFFVPGKKPTFNKILKVLKFYPMIQIIKNQKEKAVIINDGFLYEKKRKQITQQI